ncbi:MAG: hypothetical protein ACI8PZ_000461 [Myxococcota bacterium]|jgi:hypothetical protein
MALRIALVLMLAACAGKDSSDSAEDASSDDPAAACTTMCTDAGFDAGAADVYDHEVNCTCSGGGGAVDDAGCGDLCTGLGWSSAEAYAADACQCSDG